MRKPTRGLEKESLRGIFMPFWRLLYLGGDPMAEEKFRRKLTAILSADVAALKQ